MLSNLMYELGKYNINSRLYSEIRNLNEAIPIVPVSAKTNEGIPDLLVLLTQYAQKKLKNDIIFNDNFEGTIMEINQLEGFGYVVDVLVINGNIKIGDNILMNSTKGILNKTIKFILIKKYDGKLIHNNVIKATNYVSFVMTDSDDMDKVLVGSPVYIATENNYNLLKQSEDKLKSYINEQEGIYVTSSTIGTLESILILLNNMNIPY